jgi:hypothetical protein
LALLYFPEHQSAIRAASRLDIWGSPLVALLNCVALVSSAFGKHLTWRGITYRLRRGGRVRIVARQEIAPPRYDTPSQLRIDVAAAAMASQMHNHLSQRFTAAQDRKD